MLDKYTATWVSHSSIGDFLNCPKSYYLKNVYKDPKTRHKIQIMKPALALGQVVHIVLESLSSLPREKRFNKSLPVIFNKEWEKISGRQGGFLNKDQEQQYKNRGLAMINNIYHHPGPLKKLAVKIKNDLPYFWLSEEDNIILCGKIDWLEYLPDIDSVHIIDFKTGKTQEDAGSLQLPIYYLLASKCQPRKVAKASYWYLERDKQPIEKKLPKLGEAEVEILEVAKKIKLARQLEKFDCPNGDDGCFACRPMQRLINGEGKLIGTDEFSRRDVYILNEKEKNDGMESEIL